MTSDNTTTFGEMVDSLTGHEELAIQGAFGQDINTLLSSSATFAGRALAFAQYKRDGQDDTKAKESALDLTIKQVGQMFREDEPDNSLDGDEEPTSEEGKDDELDEPLPLSRPAGA